MVMVDVHDSSLLENSYPESVGLVALIYIYQMNWVNFHDNYVTMAAP